MKLPFLTRKTDDSDYYLALILTEDKACAIILKADETTIKTVSTNEEFFTDSIEDLSLEDFINVVDRTISKAEEVLPPQIETHKTVFGVKDKWVEKETKKIKKEYLEKLKKVCDALDLSPIGFMVTSEAVTHLIQDEEGAPLSAVFAEIGEKQVTLSLLRGGKTIETISSTLMHSATHTVDKLLSHFTVPVLPARIVLYLSKPDTTASQSFISHQWSKSLPFLHVPQVTVLPTGFDSRSVMYGAATQMGFTVTDLPHDVLPKLALEEKHQEDMAAAEQARLDEVNELDTSEHGEKEREKPENEFGENLDNIAPITQQDAQANEFGFVVNGNAPDAYKPEVTRHHPEHHGDIEHVENNAHMHLDEDSPHNNLVEPTHHAGKQHKIGLAKKFPFLANLPKVSFPKNFKTPSISGLSGKKAPIKIILPIVAILVLLIGTSLFYIYNVKATVALTVTPNVVNENATVTFSASVPSDFSKNVIAARTITTSIDAQLATNATGKKDVGEKAKGSVTVFNNSDDPVTVSANTEIKASNGEVFILDKDVRVAAASGDIFTGTKPGTGQGNVTAKDLGTEGNMPSGTRFTIGSTSTVAARNDSAFAGGTKKNVTVVSKADLDKLRNEIIKSVQDDAQGKVAGQAKSGETVLPVVGEPTLQNSKYDKKEGEEASKVTLRASVVYLGIAYANSELEDYAQTVIKSQYADDVNIAKNSIKSTIESTELTDNKTAESSITLQAGLLPRIDTQDVIENIQDKSLGQAKETLSNLPQVSKTSIGFSPPIFIFPDLFPRLPNQISVEVNSE